MIKNKLKIINIFLSLFIMVAMALGIISVTTLFTAAISVGGKPDTIPAVTTAKSTNSVNLSASYNWAGYVSTGGTYTSVSSTWTVLSASSTDYLAADATWVGIGGVTSKDLIQTGTMRVQNGSDATYQAWYELLPDFTQNVALTVSPGDSITATIKKQGGNQWSISLVDNTTGKKFSKTVTYKSSLSSAEWVEEMPLSDFGFISLDNFGTVKFTDAWTIKNGQKLDIAQAQAESINMKNSFGEVLASTSTISKTGFTVTRAQTNSPPSIIYLYSRGNGRWRVSRHSL